MGCSWSGLAALYEVVSSGSDVWVDERRFRIVRELGEGGFAFVYLVRELHGERSQRERSNDPSQASDDGMYALKKVLIQTDEQLELVKQEIYVSSHFNHPNLLKLLDHAIIAVKILCNMIAPTNNEIAKFLLICKGLIHRPDGGDSFHGAVYCLGAMQQGLQEGLWNQEAYLLFPVHKDGTLLDHLTGLQSRNEFFPTITVLHIFQQICAGLKEMHMNDPPYAHHDMKPGNVLLSLHPSQPPLAVIMDFGSSTSARKQIRSRSEALTLQEWAAQHCSAPYRAPELWDCPSHCDIDERTDIWSIGCTLYAIMYRESPFEYTLGESGGSLQLAAMNGQVKWPEGPTPPYPDALHQFVTWMLQPQMELRPTIELVCTHADKLLVNYGAGGQGLWPLKNKDEA